MKKLISYILLSATLSLATSCTTLVISTTPVKTNPKGKVPPGQMKKTTGSKSAKQYAPGQQKKK